MFEAAVQIFDAWDRCVDYWKRNLQRFVGVAVFGSTSHASRTLKSCPMDTHFQAFRQSQVGVAEGELESYLACVRREVCVCNELSRI